MTIRRMKSMSGIRRLWSDYGYEGILREANLWHAARALVYSASAMAGIFSFSVLALRSRDQSVFMNIKSDMDSLSALNGSTEFASLLIPLVKEELERNKLNVDDLKRAASNLRSVEADLIQLNDVYQLLRRGASHTEAFAGLSSPALKRICETAWSECLSVLPFKEKVAKDLVAMWIRRGDFNFDEVPNRALFGNRETSEAIGVDIGSQIESVISSGGAGVRYVDSKGLQQSVRLIEQWGFAVLKDAVSTEYLQALCEKWQLTQGSASENGERVKSMDANVSHSRAMVNRLNMILRGSKLEEDTRRIHSAIFPVVSCLQDRQGLQDKPLIMSDLRIVVVDEAAERTKWTIYNPRGGYTVLIPLHDRDYRMGSQEIIGGSHFLLNKSIGVFRRLSWAAHRAYMVPFPMRVADFTPDGCWRAGDALILDNRVLVRGEENKMFKSGTYLLAKYEPADSAASALFLSGKILFRLAQVWEAVSRWSHPKN